MTPVVVGQGQGNDLTAPVTRAEFDRLAESFWRGGTAKQVLRDVHRDVWEPPIVTAMPRVVQAHDGMHVRYRPQEGVTWGFVFNAKSSSTLKWEAVEDPPLTSEVANEDALAVTFSTYQDLANVGPQLTVPLVGQYEISFGAYFITTSGAGNNGYMAVKYGSIGTSDADGMLAGSAVGLYAPVGRITYNRFVATPGVTLKVQYRSATNAAGSFGFRTLSIRPIRVYAPS